MISVPVSALQPLRVSSPGLVKLILRLKLVDEETVLRIGKNAGNRKLLAALSAAGAVDEDLALKQIGASLGIVLLDNEKLKQLGADSGTKYLDQVDKKFVLENRCLPLTTENGRVLVAMADPLDFETIGQLEFLLQTQCQAALASEGLIVRFVNENFPDDTSDLGDFERLEEEQLTKAEIYAAKIDEETSIEHGSKAAPIIKLVNKILVDGISAGASDIHLEPNESSLEVRFRIDGIMTHQLSIPRKFQPYVLTRVKILSGMDITEKRKPQDGRFRAKPNKDLFRDIRVSAVPTPLGEKIVLRILNPGFAKVDLSGLDMPVELATKIENLLAGTDKIFLVTGPTGSGKTTTLYAALNYIKRGTTNIITIEDPIEFRLEGVTQIQVNPKIDVTFANGLRSILRQDPDVIFLGEIRDLETAEIAFQAAQTGHMVLSTLHTNTAASAVIRLVDLGLQPFLIASSVSGILAQRLARRVCKSCARSPKPEELKEILSRSNLKPDKLRIGQGCEQCGHSGYKGRIGVYSLLEITNDIRHAIRDGKSDAELDEIAKTHGMHDLFSSGLEMVEAGITTLDEIERVVGRPEVKTEGEVRPQATVIDQSARSSRKHQGKSIAGLVKELGHGVKSDSGRRILIIDDDEDVRKIMVESFRGADYDVKEAIDGADGLERLQQWLPDLVLCDLVMPKVDGREFVVSLRGNPKTASVPVIMLTGSDNEANEIALLEAGANDFISKASSPAVVLTRVKRILAA